MSDEEAWKLIDSLCWQIGDDLLMLTDEMVNKYGLLPFIARVIPTWTRDNDRCGWVSTERNPWSIIHKELALL